MLNFKLVRQDPDCLGTWVWIHWWSTSS